MSAGGRAWVIRLFFCLIPFGSAAQSFSSNYSPLRGYELSKSKLEQIMPRFTEGWAKGTEAEKWQKNYDLLAEYQAEGLLMHGDELSAYVIKLVEKIKAANPELKDAGTDVFILRTEVPNAASIGNGVLLVNLGLLARMDNEAELAFVLAHELAHDYLQHVAKAIKAYADLVDSKSFKENIKAVNKQDYNKSAAARELLLKYLANIRRHSQTNEFEADSLGYLFAVRAGYEPKTTRDALLALDSFDYPKRSTILPYADYLHTNTIAFDSSLLENRVYVDIGRSIDHSIPDSLKTHAECAVRHTVLEKMEGQPSVTAKSIKEFIAADYSKIGIAAEMETVELLLQRGNYDMASWMAMELMVVFPKNQYLKNVYAESLWAISDAAIKHRFAYAVSMPENHQPESIYQHLLVLNNLPQGEVLEYGKEFYAREIEPLSTADAYSGYVKMLYASNTLGASARSSLHAKYKGQFDDPYYSALLAKKFPKPDAKK